MSFTRITVRADQMGGVPCVRGLRIPVATVIGMVADGMGEAEIVAAYPELKDEDVREAIRYAAEAVRERELPLLSGDPTCPAIGFDADGRPEAEGSRRGTPRSG
jgi:uncharacterized protein (DUF433 family)